MPTARSWSRTPGNTGSDASKVSTTICSPRMPSRSWSAHGCGTSTPAISIDARRTLAIRQIAKEEFDAFPVQRVPLVGITWTEEEFHRDEASNVLGVLIHVVEDNDWA